jgi:hypothetical protein
VNSKRKPIVIDVPPADPRDPERPDAESRAVGADPDFQALIAEGRRAFAEGQGVDSEDIFRELGLTGDPATRNGVSSNGRVPTKRANTKTACR